MVMKFVVDEGAKSWFRIETVAEAALESKAMNHTVERYFREAYDKAAASFAAKSASATFERSIGRHEHALKSMPMFLTLRDREGTALVTAMLPPSGVDHPAHRVIVVGPSNADPYPDHASAIEVLGRHFGLKLDRNRCFPYKR
jgi:hypothetical protein